MSHIEAFLGEQFHSDSRLSFGYDVANAYRAKDESYIWLAQRLGQKATALLHSHDSKDVSAVSQIYHDFSHHSYRPLSERLENKLDTPLTHRPLHWLQKASPRDIALFTIANRELHLDHQAALTRDQPYLAQVVMEGVEKLVEADYYPKQAIPIYRDTLNYYGNWKALDSFESGAKRLTGICTANTIALANRYSNPNSFTGLNRFQQQTVVHELSHGVDYHGGRGFTFRHSASDEYVNFAYLEEAMAEHNAIIHEYAWSGNKNELEMNIIEPAMRSGYKNDSKIYLNERTLCGILELDPVKLAAVQLSSLDTRRGRQLRANLVAQMNRSFGSEQATFAFASSYLETPSNERDKFINRTMDILLKKPEVKASRPPVPLWRRLFAS